MDVIDFSEWQHTSTRDAGLNFFLFDFVEINFNSLHRTHFIAASTKLRGGQPYKIHVIVLPDGDSVLDLAATITWNGSSIATGRQTFLPNSHDLFPLRVRRRKNC